MWNARVAFGLPQGARGGLLPGHGWRKSLILVTALSSVGCFSQAPQPGSSRESTGASTSASEAGATSLSIQSTPEVIPAGPTSEVATQVTGEPAAQLMVVEVNASLNAQPSYKISEEDLSLVEEEGDLTPEEKTELQALGGGQ